MRWTVRYSGEQLARRLRAWFVRYPSLAAALQRRIAAELAADPDAHLGGMIVPTTTRPYRLILTPDGDGVPERLHVTFYVERQEATRELVIIEGRLRTDRFPDEWSPPRPRSARRGVSATVGHHGHPRLGRGQGAGHRDADRSGVVSLDAEEVRRGTESR